MEHKEFEARVAYRKAKKKLKNVEEGPGKVGKSLEAKGDTGK